MPRGVAGVRPPYPTNGRRIEQPDVRRSGIRHTFPSPGGPAERLVLVEIVPELTDWLRRALPRATVICGDARALPQRLPQAWHGRVGTVVCGIPLVLLPIAEQRRFTEAIQAVAPGRGFLHSSYCVTSPLPWKKLGLRAKREAWTPLNFPPASVWRYTPAG